MAKVKIQGHASGTGILTVTAPNTSTDRTITLPDATCTLADNSDVTNKLPLAGGTMTGSLTINQPSGTTALLQITADEGQVARLYMLCDQGDDHADYSRLTQDGNGLLFQNYASGFVDSLRLTPDGRAVSQFTANAWCAFNATGTPAIRDSHNVSSIGDNGTGWFYVYIDVDLANANSVCVGSGSNANNTYRILIDTAVQVTTAVYVMCSGHSTSSSVAVIDPEFVNVVVFGD
jgi:hypothetical protein